MNEAEYLELQARKAKLALRRSSSALVEDVVAPLQVREWVRHKPYWSLGCSALAGLLVGAFAPRLGRSERGAGRRIFSRSWLAGLGPQVMRLAERGFSAMLWADRLARRNRAAEDMHPRDTDPREFNPRDDAPGTEL